MSVNDEAAHSHLNWYARPTKLRVLATDRRIRDNFTNDYYLLMRTVTVDSKRYTRVPSAKTRDVRPGTRYARLVPSLNEAVASYCQTCNEPPRELSSTVTWYPDLGTDPWSGVLQIWLCLWLVFEKRVYTLTNAVRYRDRETVRHPCSVRRRYNIENGIREDGRLRKKKKSKVTTIATRIYVHIFIHAGLTK